MNFGIATLQRVASPKDENCSEKSDGDVALEGLFVASLSNESEPSAALAQDDSLAGGSTSASSTSLSLVAGAGGDHNSSNAPSPATKPNSAPNKSSKRRLDASLSIDGSSCSSEVANPPLFPFLASSVYNTCGPFPPPWMWIMPQPPSSGTPTSDTGELFKRFTQWQLFQFSLATALGNNPAMFMPPLSNFLASLPTSQYGDIPLVASSVGQQLSGTVRDGVAAGAGGQEEEEQPLDLSLGSSAAAAVMKRGSGSDVSLPNLATAESLSPDGGASSHDDNEKPTEGKSCFADIAALLQGDSKPQLGGSKRNYSQDDLNAAVLDIRSGRLGTRRASVVYGIPRSTLRNKIYKLEAADDNGEVGSSKRKRLSALAERKRTRSKAATNHDAGDGSGSGEAAPTAAPDSVLSDADAPTSSFENGSTPDASDVVGQSSSFQSAHNRKPRKPKRTKMAFASAASNALVGSSPAGNAASVAPPPLLGASFLDPFAEIIKQYVGNFNPAPEMNGDSAEEGAEQDSDLSKEAKTESSDSAADLAKKQRPKRGQYRRYEKGALERAVASVRSGEMSVHRAGSFYGVPHSTLEYKVKERNLLRHKNKQKAALLQAAATTPIGNPLASSPTTSATERGSAIAGAASTDSEDPPTKKNNSTEPLGSS